MEVCRSIRAMSDTPIIAVTEHGSELDRVLGLQAGSDDYMVKPHGFHELLARIGAVMRRVRPSPAARTIEHGPLRIDADVRRVTLHGRSVSLKRKEFGLLHALAIQPLDRDGPRCRFPSRRPMTGRRVRLPSRHHW
ncbi:response regulator transcription factor [Streptomyces lasalocidi]